jgi:hypothetical protein
MKSLPQLAFRSKENAFLFCRKVRARTVDIKTQHGHRRLVRPGFAPRAGLGRTFQAQSDSAWTSLLENIRFKIKRIAATSDLAGPAPSFGARFHLSTSPFEKLHIAFMPFRRRQCRKRSEISPLSCFWILFAGVEAVSTRFQFLNHKVMELILPMLPEHHQAIRFPRNST